MQETSDSNDSDVLVIAITDPTPTTVMRATKIKVARKTEVTKAAHLSRVSWVARIWILTAALVVVFFKTVGQTALVVWNPTLGATMLLCLIAVAMGNTLRMWIKEEEYPVRYPWADKKLGYFRYWITYQLLPYGEQDGYSTHARRIIQSFGIALILWAPILADDVLVGGASVPWVMLYLMLALTAAIAIGAFEVQDHEVCQAMELVRHNEVLPLQRQILQMQAPYAEIYRSAESQVAYKHAVALAQQEERVRGLQEGIDEANEEIIRLAHLLEHERDVQRMKGNIIKNLQKQIRGRESAIATLENASEQETQRLDEALHLAASISSVLGKMPARSRKTKWATRLTGLAELLFSGLEPDREARAVLLAKAAGVVREIDEPVTVLAPTHIRLLTPPKPDEVTSPLHKAWQG